MLDLQILSSKILMSHGERKPRALNTFVLRKRGKTGGKRLRRGKIREGGFLFECTCLGH